MLTGPALLGIKPGDVFGPLLLVFQRILMRFIELGLVIGLLFVVDRLIGGFGLGLRGVARRFIELMLALLLFVVCLILLGGGFALWRLRLILRVPQCVS